MKLSALIAAYGDDKVEAQFLDQCATSLYTNKGVTKITFGTEQPVSLDGTQKLGIIVWLDRDRVKQITAQSKAEAASCD